MRRRVVAAAEAALADHSYVSCIDVLLGMQWVTPPDVQAWRNGRVDFLERSIQANLRKVSEAMAMFRRWADDKGLKPSETGYVRRARNGTVALRFSVSGDPEIEKRYRTHFVSPMLSERKRQNLQEKLERDPRATVFQVVRDSECSECGTEIAEGSFLMLDAGQPLCLACAHLDELEFLPAGDTALTRRATRLSSNVATVVRFSRSRKRYERQGILVEPSAVEEAEKSCAQDADQRAAARLRGAERRTDEDRRLVARMAREIAMLFPGCPAGEVEAVAEHTARRGSGRVGRTEAGRNLQEKALSLAVIAAIRHKHTDYDALLAGGMDRETARRSVAPKVEAILQAWRQ